MNHPVEFSDHDELRGRFTRFMEVLVKHAKINYMKKLSRQPEEISLDVLPEEMLAIERSIDIVEKTDDFCFEEELLADAFQRLPLMRRQILKMLFVDELKPAEIALRMNCSVNHVYNQRSLAIKALRSMLDKGGELKE